MTMKTKQEIIDELEQLKEDLYYTTVHIELDELCYIEEEIDGETVKYADDDFEEKYEEWIFDDNKRTQIYRYGISNAISWIEKKINEILEK